MNNKAETDSKNLADASMAMLENAPVGCIFWDQRFNCVDCNKEILVMFGEQDKATVLNNFHAFSPKYQPSGRSSLELFSKQMEAVLKDGKAVHKWYHLNKDKQLFPVEVTLLRVLMPDGYHIVSYTRDLRAYEEQERIAKESQKRSQLMLDASPVGVSFFDLSGRMIDCNLEVVKLYGAKDKHEIIDNFLSFSPEFQPNGKASAEMVKEVFEAAYSDGQALFEWTHLTKSGTVLNCVVKLVRTMTESGQYSVLGFIENVTEQKRIDMLLKQTTNYLQLMFDAAPLCSVTFDEENRFIDCNLKTLKIFGLKKKDDYPELFKQMLKKMQPDGESSQKLFYGMLDKAFSGGRSSFECYHVDVHGELIPMEMTLVRMAKDGKLIVAAFMRDLRDDKAAKAQMDEANERVRIMLDATPLCCNFWDEHFNNTDCNEEAVKLFELSSKQEYLERFFELSPEYQPNGERSDQMASLYITNAFKNGRVVFEWMHQKLSGELIPSEITLVRVKRGEGYIVVGYTRDLRELKKTQEALDIERQFLKNIMKTCPVSFVTTRNMTVTYTTPFTTGHLGIEAGDNLTAFAAYPDKIKLLVEKLVKVHTVDWEPLVMKTKNGIHREMLANILFAREGEDTIATMWFVDVTELKAVENELILARDAAENSARTKSEFLANMSHEIRTPMNAILGMTNLTLKTELTNRQRDYIAKADNAAKSLLRIINDILDFSKIEAGKLDIECAEFSIDSVLAEISGILGHAFEHKNLAFFIDKDPDIPLSLSGDPLRIKQVLLNLLNNAIKFTGEGAVSLSVQHVSSSGSDSLLQFSVKDSGIGMTREQVGNLFNAFVQADTSTTRRYGGTGLGLVISKRLVELMNGSIWCESELGVGTTFNFTIRVGNNDASFVSSTASSIGKNVIVISDNAATLELFEKSLTALSCKILENVTNLSDLFAFRSEKLKEADFFLIDLLDPYKDMDRCLSAISECFNGGFPPIIFSMNSQEFDLYERLKVPAKEMLLKPYSLSSLYNSIVDLTTSKDYIDADYKAPSEPVIEGDGFCIPEYLVGSRILLAEDNEINQILASELIEMGGFVVEVVSNGKEAIDMLLVYDYDMVFMDIQMPEMDGLTATKLIRANSKIKKLPIVAITAHAMDGDRELSLAAGMNDHITKPLEPAILYKTIVKWLLYARAQNGIYN